LSKRLRDSAGEVRDADEQIVQECWHLTSWFDRTAAVVIFQPKADYAPIPQATRGSA
jgi:hypothetical protein